VAPFIAIVLGLVLAGGSTFGLVRYAASSSTPDPDQANASVVVYGSTN
jgi:hypothetical protein